MSEMFSGVVGAVLGSIITVIASWKVHKNKQKAEFGQKTEEFARLFLNNFINKAIGALEGVKCFNFEAIDGPQKKDLIREVVYKPLKESREILENDLGRTYPIEFIDDYSNIKNGFEKLLIKIEIFTSYDSSEHYKMFGREMIEDVTIVQNDIINLNIKLRKIYKAL
ncbi:hypothetical protein HNO89_001359 [Sporosarcina luteola]|nr:hypothetical protein [Sporosarcina luteola]